MNQFWARSYLFGDERISTIFSLKVCSYTQSTILNRLDYSVFIYLSPFSRYVEQLNFWIKNLHIYQIDHSKLNKWISFHPSPTVFEISRKGLFLHWKFVHTLNRPILIGWINQFSSVSYRFWDMANSFIFSLAIFTYIKSTILNPMNQSFYIHFLPFMR